MAEKEVPIEASEVQEALDSIEEMGRAALKRVDLPPHLVPLRMREFRVSGSSVFWWMERSGIRQNTGGRERGRGLVAKSAMPSPVVVVKTPSINHPASVLQPEEQLPVEQLVTELSVE